MANVDQMLAIASQKASDRMRHVAVRADQTGRTATQIMSCSQHKQIRTNRLRQQNASAR
jgi:hypothetical protein